MLIAQNPAKAPKSAIKGLETFSDPLDLLRGQCGKWDCFNTSNPELRHGGSSKDRSILERENDINNRHPLAFFCLYEHVPIIIAETRGSFDVENTFLNCKL